MVNVNSVLNKCLSKGNITSGAVRNIMGKDVSKDKKIKGMVCNRCKGKKTIKLGKNIIMCPVCKGKGAY